MRRGIILILIAFCFISISSIKGQLLAVEAPPLHITGGNTVVDYQMVSFPVKPYDDQDPLTNEHILIDELGNYNPYEWRCFQWDSCFWNLELEQWEFIEQHIELNDREGEIKWGADQNIEPGRGYWIISRYTRDIYVEGDLPSEEYTLLEPGWNQIGNIYFVQTDTEIQFEPFPISNLFVGPESGPGEVRQLIDPENPYTYITLQDYINGSYINRGGESNLEVGKGYWLNNIDIQQRRLRLWFRIANPGSVSNRISVTKEYFERIAQQEDPPSPPSAVESSSSSVPLAGGSGGGGGGCFIATAAYGDYGYPNVKLLREFRDRYLLTNGVGRIFVSMYYQYGPSLARFTAASKSMRALVRFSLIPVIGVSAIASKMNVYGFLIIVAFPFLGSLFIPRRRKGAWGKCKPKFSRKSKEGKGKA